MRQPTKAGANIGGANEHNRRVVMHGLRVNGAMSRAQIARGTGLVPQTVSNIIDDLAREGLVIAAEPIRSGRGQPAIPYSIAADGAFALGLQIDAHRVRAVAVNLLGQIVAGVDHVMQAGGLQRNLPVILAALREVSAAPPLVASSRPPRILGIGVAMPAPMGVHAMRDDPWMVDLNTSHPIIEVLRRETGLPVSLHHDASAAAVAERINGQAVGMESFVLVFVSYGVGAGIYVAGELSRGHHSLGGELGIVKVPHDGRMVPLEDRTSLKILLSRLGLEPDRPDLFARLEEALHSGSLAVQDWLTDSARHLAWAIDMIHSLLDPECIVMGGQMPEDLMDALFAAIEQTQREAASGSGPSRRLFRGSVAPLTVAAGAAADPIARAFDPSLAAMMKDIG